MMHRLSILAALGLAGMAATAVAQGQIGTIERGNYECGLPGDATGEAWVVQPDKGFAIISASSYRTSGDGGTYLRRGNRIVFTRGPLKGMELRRLSSGLLQQVSADGALGRMRCHRVSRLAPE